MEERANEAERAVENGRSKKLYKITKLIIGGAKKQSVGIRRIRDKNGNINTERNDIMERWKEHLYEIFNREDPKSPIREEEIVEEQNIENIYTVGRFTKEEVRIALRHTRNGKAAEVDHVGPDLLKADMAKTTNKLHKLFNNLWETDTWPDIWKQGLIDN